jgi:succinate dehydrogenase / fumarate reductase cytochrome b subunit
MSLTGIFLILFLAVHLAGNLQLLKDDGGMAFNVYAKFMTSNPLIKITSYGLYATFLLHIFLSLFLSIANRRSRGSAGYAIQGKNKGVTWSSRNMGILGTVIFVFLVIHLKNFWYEMHWGGIPTVIYDGTEVKDLYSVVSAAYGELWYVIFYVVGMFAVGFHLYHGFQSAFQSLGINHKKYTPAIKFAGVAYSLIVPGLFAIIPILMYLN